MLLLLCLPKLQLRPPAPPKAEKTSAHAVLILASELVPEPNILHSKS